MTICIVISSGLLIVTTVNAMTINESLQVDSLKVGKQGSGGVTYFNGTIINDTKTNGVDNPVTFGDNVRIDGYVYRGSTAGSGDSKPFKINDDVEITGTLTVDGQRVTAAADYTSRFNTLDSTLSVINTTTSGNTTRFNTIDSTLTTINTNIVTTNDSVGNSITTTANAYNAQVDLLNQLSYHAGLNCLSTQYLAGLSLDYCETPIYIGRLTSKFGFMAAPSIQDDPKVKGYQEKFDQLRELMKNR